MLEEGLARDVVVVEGASAGLWERHKELASYLIAGIVYIALGFVAKQVFAWWTYGAVFAVLTVWGVPVLWRRLRP